MKSMQQSIRYVLTEKTTTELRRLRDLWVDVRDSDEYDEREKSRISSAIGHARRELAKAEPAPPTGCPQWCNAHQWTFVYDIEEIDDPVDTSWHQHRETVGALAVDVCHLEADEGGDLHVWLPSKESYTLAEARAVAATIEAACNAVEGAGQ